MEKIIKTEYGEEMQKSYLDYSMSVITARAIPDARDGLKPVQRRVLYDMSELRTTHDKPHKKSARIVGDAMGKYHPHGDSSIYETLVVMSQAWKKGMPLVDGHGNFGSIEGDGAAAMRYTEARLRKFTEDVYLKDLDKTVEYVPNYDGDTVEPEVLPVRVPNLLINGADGIAVGMSTSIPPHNLGEVCDACIAYIKNRDITIPELLRIMPGPDFPTGGIVANKSDLQLIYMTGIGKLKLRGKVEVELGRRKTDKDKLIISEIPYTMIGAGIGKFLEDVADLVEKKILPEIVDISNQSDKDGMRIVLELKKDADINKITNILYKKTKLEDTFGVNMLAIAHGRPETLDLKGILSNYLDFQYENQTKKYNVLLAKALDKQEVEEGLIRACDVIDDIIRIIRTSKTREQAKERIMGDLGFTERQTQAILEMRLYKLIGLEVDALIAENKETKKNIKRYREILKSKDSMDDVLIKDLEEIKKEYAIPRRTRLEDAAEAVYEEPAIEEEEVVFVMDKFGYCKTIDRAVYDRNAEIIETDYKFVVPVWNIDKLCFFTSAGNMHSVKVLDIPAGKMKDKGTPLDNLCKFSSDKEEILAVHPTAEMDGHSMVFVTADGLVKKVSCTEFETNNRTVASTKLADGDKLVSVILINVPETDIVFVTDNDYVLRFPMSEVSEMKKTSKGEKGMKLGKGESVVSAWLIGATNAIKVRGRDLQIGRLSVSHRYGRGSKVRPQ
ncbi:MAG: DNA topoisomerase (ATP-hydrolyzing) [Lachnospiraceae bacterium]|nr:DNA topoisomerase (ATP-hydrolyzing) [Lachnospiraceae bacterium]